MHGGRGRHRRRRARSSPARGRLVARGSRSSPSRSRSCEPAARTPRRHPAASASGIATDALRSGGGLQIDQMDRLPTGRARARLRQEHRRHAARDLAEHAIALLGAPSAVVLIEGIGDTVRVTAGDAPVGVRRRQPHAAARRRRGAVRIDRRQRARRRHAVLRRSRSDARRTRAAGVVDAPPALAVHRGAVRAAHARRRARVVVRRHLHGGPRHARCARGTRPWRSIIGIPASDAVGHPVGAVFRPSTRTAGRATAATDPGASGDARGRPRARRRGRRRGAVAHLQLVAAVRGRLRGRGPRRDRAQEDPGRQGRLDRAGQPRAAHAPHADQGLPAHAAAPRRRVHDR